MGKIDLVIFDCDGVLADSEVISAEVLVAELRRHGIPIDIDHVYRNFVGISFPNVADMIEVGFDVTLPDSFEAAYRDRVLAEFGQRLQPTNGIAAVLRDLACAKCVATSSGPPRVAATLQRCGLTQHFGDNVFTASEVANGKPAPDLFLHAATRMGVAAENCLVIEDSRAGVEAGIAAGMAVFRYTGGRHLAGLSQTDLATPRGVPGFDDWSEFYQMAPGLRRGTAR